MSEKYLAGIGIGTIGAKAALFDLKGNILSSGYSGIESLGYTHTITRINGNKASDLLPHVHTVVSLLKRWILGTHQGSVSKKHLGYYLDEFTFRFNRRTSNYRGKLFYRLLENAVLIGPTIYEDFVNSGNLQEG